MQTPPLWQAFLLSAIGLAFKAPDSLTNPQFWAEDATVFFAEQHPQVSPLLLKPYASYFHLVPRLVAWAAHAVSAVHAPTLYCFSAWLIGALALVSLRQLQLAGVPYWVLLAAVILTPTNGEIFGTLTNLQWLMQFYLLGALARSARSDGTPTPTLRIVLMLLVGLSGPFSIFAAAAAVVMVGISWLEARRRGASRLAWNGELSVLCIAGCVQTICIWLEGVPVDQSLQTVTVASVARVLSLSQLHAIGAQPLSPPVFGLLVIFLLVAPLWWLDDRATRYALLGIYTFVGLQTASIIPKFPGILSELLASVDGDRYFVANKALLIWLAAMQVVWVTRSYLKMRTWVFVLAVVGSLPFSWPRLQRAGFPDLHWRERAAQLDAGGAAVIAVWPPGWVLRVDATPNEQR